MSAETPNPRDPIENLAIGKIIEVDGTRIIAELDPKLNELTRIYAGDTYPIGQFGSIIRIYFGRKVLYALVGRLRMKADYEAEHGVVASSGPDERIVEADLFGEGEWTLESNGTSPEWRLQFSRGVSTYPLPQQTIYLTPKAELKFIYGQSKGAVITLGVHVGSGDTPCYADLNELIGKHTAILGSTGSGKSGTTAAVVHSILAKGAEAGYATWLPRIIILDPHNEYGAAFPGHTALSTDNGSLVLPYWLLNLQECIALLIGKTEFVATSQSNIVKTALLKARQEGAVELGLDRDRVTVDSPVPYKLSRFRELVDTDKPPQASKQDSHLSILEKLEVLQRDSRMRFLMTDWAGGPNDPLTGILAQLIGSGLQPRIVDLSGVPNEVAGITSSVIARTLFNLKVWQTPEERQANPVLLICEEAHRYVPNRGEAQYEAAQEAIRRIAKEGRKYGVGLMLVSQRPSEVDGTVLSQCNSWIVLRLSNEVDRAHVAAILPDSMAGLTKMLSGLRRQEAIFLGQAAVLPSRIMIRSLETTQLPRSQDMDYNEGWQQATLSVEQIKVLGNRWRYQQR